MRIIVVGGGFCGTLVVKGLERAFPKADIILIDRKDYFEFTPSIHKVIFDSKYFRKITIPFKKIFSHARVIVKQAQEIRPDHVKVDGKKLRFDYLVISTGVSYPIYLRDTRNVCTLKHSFEAFKMGSKILGHKRILVIGGGLIGTEIAGEIVTKAKDRNVIIVHPAKRLLERNPLQASAYAERFLRKRGAQIIFGEKVKEHKGDRFITDKKRVIEAGAAIWCAGIKAEPNYMKCFPKRVFSDHHALNVDPHLRLIGYNNIFVGGDITAVKEEKTAQNAERHARTIVCNIKASIRATKLHHYRPRSFPLVISLGDWNAIFSTSRFAWGGLLPATLKKAIEAAVLFRYRFLAL